MNSAVTLLDIFQVAFYGSIAGGFIGCALCVVGVPISLAIYDKWRGK